jgi:hypothetical protein
MSDCDSTLITDVTLMDGETVLLDFTGDGGFCGCSAECCPRDCGRLTNRRIIVLQRSVGFPVLATALLEDVTACLMGRQRPRWRMILPLFFTGCLVVFLASDPAFPTAANDPCTVEEKNNEYHPCSRPRPPDATIILYLIGFWLMGLAVWIFRKRPTAIHFFVKGSQSSTDCCTDRDNGFSITVENRGVAIDLLDGFFAAKTFTTSVGSPLPMCLRRAPPRHRQEINPHTHTPTHTHAHTGARSDFRGSD